MCFGKQIVERIGCIFDGAFDGFDMAAVALVQPAASTIGEQDSEAGVGDL